MHERPQKAVDLLPKIGLMLPQQIEYYTSWHGLVGDQRRVLYNAMGPDVSTVLLTTNAERIVGVDVNGFYADSFQNELKSSWEIPASEVRFNEDLAHRRTKGYWDMTDIQRWGTERLLALELKELGVDRNEIQIRGDRDGRLCKIRFLWPYPGEGLRNREVIYLRGTLEEVMGSNRGKHVTNLDCFYQKGLPDFDLTPYYLRIVLPRLKDTVTVAIGYKTWGKNENFGEEIWDTLGSMFAWLGVDPRLEMQINRLPDEDPASAMVQYGMKLHVFKRG